MTVAAELLKTSGAIRRLLLKIEGVKEIFFERVADPTGSFTAPTWSSRTGINCLLRPESELTSSLDLGDLSLDRGTLDISLIDIDDPIANDGTSYFGKLFAPSRNQANNVSPTTAQAIADTAILPDATTIYAKNNTEFAALASSGDAFILGERITYTGKGTTSTTTTNNYHSDTLGTLTGVTKGVYPAIANPRGSGTSTMGRAYLYRNRAAKDSSAIVKRGPLLSDEPLSLAGRMVALYVTAWDFATGDWFGESDAKLIWVGTIAGGVTWTPNPSEGSGHWTVTCDGIAGMLDEKVARDMPTARVVGINLNGQANSRTVYAEAMHRNSSGAVVDLVSFEYAVPAAYYRIDDLADKVLQAMQSAANWTSKTGTAKPAIVSSGATKGSIYGPALSDGVFSFQIGFPAAGSNASMSLYVGPLRNKGAVVESGLPWIALGFPPQGDIYGADIDGSTYMTVTAPNAPYDHFQPLNLDENNSRMLVVDDAANPLESDQGDHGTSLSMAYVATTATIATLTEVEISDTAIAYTASESGTSPDSRFPSVLELTLAAQKYQPGKPHLPGAFAAARGRDGLEMRQAIVPAFRSDSQVERGPFEQLLYMLLSTGKADYNDADDTTYDKMPARYGIGFPVALVDKQSFLDADAHARSLAPTLARRSMHIISDETKFSDLLAQEQQLFGFALVFDLSQGKISLRNVYAPATSSVQTLSESNTARSDDYPSIETSTDTVVTQWRYLVGWRRYDKKYRYEYVVKNMRAEDTTRGAVREVAVRHKGVEMDAAGVSDFSRIVEDAVLAQRMIMLGTPRQRMSRTCNATLLGLVSVGDTVLLNFDYASWDPFNGDKTLDAYALVIGLSWNMLTYSATVDLFVFDENYTVPPWAPAALITAYDGANYRLTLSNTEYGRSGDDDDGAAFSSGDKVKIYERADLGASSSGPWTATVASTYETDGAGILTLTGAPSGTGAIDPTTRDYVVTFDDYANVVTAQQTRGLFGADPSTWMLDANTKAQRWG